MQLDMHQDQWHETYGGEGVPDWALHRPAPYDLLPPVVAPFPTGYWTPEVSTVFDDFWADRAGCSTAGPTPGGSRRSGGRTSPT